MNPHPSFSLLRCEVPSPEVQAAASRVPQRPRGTRSPASVGSTDNAWRLWGSLTMKDRGGGLATAILFVFSRPTENGGPLATAGNSPWGSRLGEGRTAPMRGDGGGGRRFSRTAEERSSVARGCFLSFAERQAHRGALMLPPSVLHRTHGRL